MAPAMNPRTVWRCQPMLRISSLMLTPPLRCISAITWAILLPARGVLRVLANGVLPVFFPLGAALAAVAFFFALPWAGAPWAAGAPTVAFVAAFGLARGADSGSTLPIWPMRCQILPAALLGSCRRVRGCTPGRLLYVDSRRSAGHWAISSANSCWLVKTSKGVWLVAAAASTLGKAVMLPVSVSKV